MQLVFGSISVIVETLTYCERSYITIKHFQYYTLLNSTANDIYLQPHYSIPVLFYFQWPLSRVVVSLDFTCNPLWFSLLTLTQPLRHCIDNAWSKQISATPVFYHKLSNLFKVVELLFKFRSGTILLISKYITF